MTLGELKTRLDGTGYPVAYSHFEEGQNTPVPFICYMETSSDNFYADNRTYWPVSSARIELYTDKKDLEAEGKVETALYDIPYEKSETYIDSEKLFQIIYEIEV